MANLSISINGVTVPLDRIDQLEETIEENASDNVTLDGTLYTDFINRRRGWKVHLPFLCVDDYDDIRAEYNSQFSTETYVNLEIPYYSIDVLARMTINDKNIKRDGDEIRGIELTFLEQYAVS